jgi:hypothetical protein
VSRQAEPREQRPDKNGKQHPWTSEPQQPQSHEAGNTVTGHLHGSEQAGKEEKDPDHEKRGRTKHHRQQEFLHRRQSHLGHLVVGLSAHWRGSTRVCAVRGPGAVGDTESALGT